MGQSRMSRCTGNLQELPYGQSPPFLFKKVQCVGAGRLAGVSAGLGVTQCCSRAPACCGMGLLGHCEQS